MKNKSKLIFLCIYTYIAICIFFKPFFAVVLRIRETVKCETKGNMALHSAVSLPRIVAYFAVDLIFNVKWNLISMNPVTIVRKKLKTGHLTSVFCVPSTHSLTNVSPLSL